MNINSKGLTYEEIAQIMGVTPQAVMQIERRALAKCRKAFKKIGVNVEDVAEIRAPEGDTLEKTL